MREFDDDMIDDCRESDIKTPVEPIQTHLFEDDSRESLVAMRDDWLASDIPESKQAIVEH